MLVLPVLGVDVLRPLVTREPRPNVDEAPILHLKEVGVVAAAKEIDGVFVVLKGSTARRQHSQSWEANIAWRDSLVAEGKLIVKDDTRFEFVEDVEFNSPSAAAATVVASPRSGRVSWVLEDGRTYGQWKESQIAAAEQRQ